MRILVLFLTILLFSCSNVKKTIEYRNHDKLVGAWSWSEQKCSSPSMYVSFSDDGKKMYADNTKGLYIGVEIARKRIVYNIISESENLLVTSIMGEGRKNSSGSPVWWDLVIQSNTKICWRRSDWLYHQCTKSLTKCD